MKKYLSILCCMTLLLSCGNDEKDSLSVSSKNLSFESGGGEQVVEVSSNTPWSITTGSGWYTITPDGGNGNGSITVKVDPNKKYESRSGNFHITAGSRTEEIVFTQAAAEPVYLVETITETITGSSVNGPFVTRYQYDDQYRLTLDGSYTFEYDGNGYISKYSSTEYGTTYRFAKTGNTVNLQYEIKFTSETETGSQDLIVNDKDQDANSKFDENGNVTERIIKPSPNQSITFTLKYDTKNSPFRHVNMPQWFLMYFLGVSGISNNCTEGVYLYQGGPVTYTSVFEYNSNGYPVKETMTLGDNQNQLEKIERTFTYFLAD